jgi:hypothetical protein
MSEQVTIGERYRKATTTSNLKVEARRAGDADLLIAAGWADSLGIKLYRLAGEFDQVAQDLHRAHTQTDAIMVMSHLKTLNQTRIALLSFATAMVPRWGVADPHIIAILVGRVLSAWLDPNCPRCGGTGTIGGYDGKVANICRRCAGSGKTRHGLGESDAERYAAQRLLMTMDAKMGEADEVMKRYLKGGA